MFLRVQSITLVLCLLIASCKAQEYDYPFGNYEDAYDDIREAEQLYEGDTYAYYSDDDQQYYEEFGVYDEHQAYDDYFVDEYEEDMLDDCIIDTDGKPTVKNGTIMCPIKVSGVDAKAKFLKGGIDGVYDFVSCYHGKPLYKRTKSPKGEERTLWYSHASGDWDVSRGAEPNMADILLYGDERENAVLPFAVKKWSLVTKSSANHTEDKAFVPVSVKLQCADGTKISMEEVQRMSEKPQLMLTDEEIEKKYKYIYDQGSKRPPPSPTVNFTVVVLMVMTGLTFVLAIPYLLGGRRKRGGKTVQPFSGSLAQAISASKKKQSGRAN